MPIFKHSEKHNPNTAVIFDVTFGKGSSNTGVDFRWHTREEYSKINTSQCDELYIWQISKQGNAAMKASKATNKGGENNTKFVPQSHHLSNSRMPLKVAVIVLLKRKQKFQMLLELL